MVRLSKEQIRKVLNAISSYKMKAVILFARDSGMRIGDITNLPIRIVRAALNDPSLEFHTFEWKQIRTKTFANPVIGPDSLDALRMWINYRVKVLKISAEDGDPLFCGERASKAYTDKLGRYTPEVVRGDKMDEGTVVEAFRRLVKKANLKPLPGETRLPGLHYLRQHHKTTLEYAGVPISWVNKMQGRIGEGTGGTYIKPNPDQLIEMFKKGYPALNTQATGQRIS